MNMMTSRYIHRINEMRWKKYRKKHPGGVGALARYERDINAVSKVICRH